MDKRRWMIAGMWIAALAAIAGIYVTFEPDEDTGPTREEGDAPTYTYEEDRAPTAARTDVEVSEDPGSTEVYRGGPRHSGRSPYRGPGRPDLAWRHHTGARVSAQAVASADAIFVGTHGRDLLAISRDGERLWSAGVHQRVWSAAAVHEGTVFVGSDVGALFAFDAADGTLAWRFRAAGDVDGPITVGDDGSLYFTGGPFLYAMNADGTLRWRFRARGPFLLTAPALDSDGTLYATSIDDHLYAVSAEGRLRWDYASDDDISSSPVIGDDGTIYFGSDDRNVHAVTRDGELRWTRALDGFVRAPVALGRNTNVIAAVYGPRPRVVSLDARTGDLRWYFPVQVAESSEIGIGSGPLVDADGNLYFGAQDDYVYSLGPDGDLRWIYQTGGDVDAAPLLLSDGTLVIGCDDGFLYAFREGATPAEAPEAESTDGVSAETGTNEDEASAPGQDPSEAAEDEPEGTPRDETIEGAEAPTMDVPAP
ncbi:MAG: PQQ-binding-like beta-propeller repeat protein [Sandaracinaceae bacterium]